MYTNTIKRLSILTALLSLLMPASAMSSAKLSVWCKYEEAPKVWIFNDMQEGRDFAREECPPCVTKVILETVCVPGIDDPDSQACAIH